jgi:hypothetical protein
VVTNGLGSGHHIESARAKKKKRPPSGHVVKRKEEWVSGVKPETFGRQGRIS